MLLLFSISLTVESTVFCNLSERLILLLIENNLEYMDSKINFCSEGFTEILMSELAPLNVIFDSNWICLDIFPFLGILFVEYPDSNPPPCQSPIKSAPIETIRSAIEKS